MEEVLASAIAEGDGWTQGRALVTLAEAAVLREADVSAAEQMIDNALEVFEPDDHNGRYRALRARATIAWMRGDLAKEEEVMLEALELARASEHKGFESEAADELASVYLARLELDRAAPLIEQAILLAEESGSAEAREGAALRGPAAPAAARARRRRGGARGCARAPGGGRRCLVARPHAQLRRLDRQAQGRSRQG